MPMFIVEYRDHMDRDAFVKATSAEEAEELFKKYIDIFKREVEILSIEEERKH